MSTSLTASDRRELISLLIEFERLSRSGARRAVTEASHSSLSESLARLRRLKLEKHGQQLIDLPSTSSPVASEPRSKSKKVPYTLLLPPDQLEALKLRSEADDSSVSHHIRQAIRLYLKAR